MIEQHGEYAFARQSVAAVSLFDHDVADLGQPVLVTTCSGIVCHPACSRKIHICLRTTLATYFALSNIGLS